MNQLSKIEEQFFELERMINEDALNSFKNFEIDFEKAQTEIEKSISNWFLTYNPKSYSDAKIYLTSKELKSFKNLIDDFLKLRDELDPTWTKKLETLKDRVNISRLDKLKIEIKQQIEWIMYRLNDMIESKGIETYNKQYEHVCYETQKEVGYWWVVALLLNTDISKSIEEPWTPDGRNFSDRIWDNKQKLLNELDIALTNLIIRKANPDEVINYFAKKLNVSKVNASRLIRTELAYFSSIATKRAYEELNVKYYSIVAILDQRTSEICRAMNGTVFKRSEYEIGVTAPPFHVNCRSTTAPYKNYTKGEKSVKIEKNIKFDDWKKKFML